MAPENPPPAPAPPAPTPAHPPPAAHPHPPPDPPTPAYPAQAKPKPRRRSTPTTRRHAQKYAQKYADDQPPQPPPQGNMAQQSTIRDQNIERCRCCGKTTKRTTTHRAQQSCPHHDLTTKRNPLGRLQVPPGEGGPPGTFVNGL